MPHDAEAFEPASLLRTLQQQLVPTVIHGESESSSKPKEETRIEPASREPELEAETSQGKPFVENLRETISTYENMAAMLRSQGKDATQIEALLSVLKRQFNQCLAGTGESPAKSGNRNARQDIVSAAGSSPSKMGTLTVKERRIRGLQEIFHFYNKQRAYAHPAKTFEMVSAEMNTMSMGYFLKFLKDFHIDIDLQVCSSSPIGRGSRTSSSAPLSAAASSPSTSSLYRPTFHALVGSYRKDCCRGRVAES